MLSAPWFWRKQFVCWNRQQNISICFEYLRYFLLLLYIWRRRLLMHCTLILFIRKIVRNMYILCVAGFSNITFSLFNKLLPFYASRPCIRGGSLSHSILYTILVKWVLTVWGLSTIVRDGWVGLRQEMCQHIVEDCERKEYDLVRSSFYWKIKSINKNGLCLLMKYLIEG